MTIGRKLHLSLGAALTLTVATGGFALSRIGALGTEERRILREDARALDLASGIQTVMAQLSASELGVVLSAGKKDRAGVEKYAKDFRDSAARGQNVLDELAQLCRAAEAEAAIAEMQAALPRIVSNHEDIIRLIREEETKAAEDYLNRNVNPLLTAVSRMPPNLVAIQEQLLTDDARAAESEVAQSRGVTAAMIGFALLVGAVTSYVVGGINWSLRKTAREICRLAEEPKHSAALSGAVERLAAMVGSGESAGFTRVKKAVDFFAAATGDDDRFGSGLRALSAVLSRRTAKRSNSQLSN